MANIRTTVSGQTSVSPRAPVPAPRLPESLHRLLFDSTDDAILILDLDGRILEANPAACESLQYERWELLQLRVLDIDGAEGDPGAARLDRLRRSGRLVFEAEHRRRDGSRIPVEVNCRVLNLEGQPAILYAARDLSDRARGEQRLREAAAHWDRTFNAIGDGISLLDHHGTILQCNEAMCRFIEQPREHIIGRKCHELVHGRGTFITECPFIRMLSTRQREVSELRIADRWLEVSTDPLFAPDGALTAAVHIIRATTEQRRAAERIRSQARLLDLAHDAIIVRDLQDRVLFWNKSAERIYGWTAAEALGRPAAELLYRDAGPLAAARRHLLEFGEWSGEMRHVTRTGKELLVASRWTLVRDPHGQPESILIINTDITEQKHLENQYLRAQRMESVGTMASGIAHDLNNILAPIMMLLPALREEVQSAELRNLLDSAESGINRAADIIKQILTFARGVPGAKGPVCLAPLVKEVGQLLAGTFPREITIEASIPDDLWTVEGDATQLHQVLMNLCLNARDAMPSGGQLTLVAENLTLDAEAAARAPGLKPGSHIVLLVADTGAGIPPDVIERIFDPFFTTKAPGKGTGLGLSTVIGIIRQHNGIIQVNSQVGIGTQFRIYLPARAGETGPAADAEQLPRGDGETVLIVDDEDSVRHTLAQILVRHNYQVLTAVDGVEAVQVFKQNQARIRLVIMDLLMPRMGGRDTIPLLRRIAPRVPIVVISGLTTDLPAAGAGACEADALLKKPVAMPELLRTARALVHP